MWIKGTQRGVVEGRNLFDRRKGKEDVGRDVGG
jgi:hypothetical protein